ncbi:MAG: type II secretion system protein GspM [Actinomycetota bacterium]|nr:type II secretion system protein GspM [Actinomycetota bacterium]
MTSRDRIVVAVVAVVALLLGYWFLILGPKRDQAQKLSSQVSQAQQTRDAAVADAAASRAAQTQYPSNYATVARLGKAIPADDDVPSLVYQLSTVSQAAHIDFRTVKLSTSAGGGSNAPPAATSGGSSAPASGGTATSAAPAAAAQSATAGLPPGAVVGPAGLPTLPFSFTFDGGFFHLSNFFARLDALIAARKSSVDVRGRLLTVDGISLAEGRGGFPDMTATVAATAFLVPASEGTTNGATPGAPAQAVPQSVSNPGSSRGATATPATLVAPVSP